MMRRIKPAFAILLCLVLTALPACEKEEPVSEYELEVLSDLTKEAGIETRLPGFSRDLCIVDPEDSYDETLIPSKYAGLFNETAKEVVYAKNTASKIYPASMTKTMTALLTVENCADLSAEVTVTEERLHVVEPVFAAVSVELWVSVMDMDDSFELQPLLKEIMDAYLDPVGYRQGRGWKIGSLPKKTQILMRLNAIKSKALIKRSMINVSYRDAFGFHEADLEDVVLTPYMVPVSGEHKVHILY